MTTCRIEFLGMGGICDAQKIRVDRTQPAALKAHITSSDWKALCDGFDDALEPMNQTKICQRIFSSVCIAIFMMPFIALPIMIGTGALGIADTTSSSTTTSDSAMDEEVVFIDENLNNTVFIDEDINNTTATETTVSSAKATGPPVLFILFFFGAMIAFFSLICSQCHFRASHSNVMGHVRELCARTSNLFPDLTFHLRNQRREYYGFHKRGLLRSFFEGHIEVSIANVKGYVESPYSKV